jgi:4-alpha-glucanotransferase
MSGPASNSLSGCDRLAAQLGVELNYVNAAGERIDASPAAVKGALAAFGFPVTTDADAEGYLRALAEEDSRRIIPPVMVIREADLPAIVPVNPRYLTPPIRWRLALETGEERTGTMDGAAFEHDLVTDKSGAMLLRIEGRIPQGYHSLHIDMAAMRLIVTPSHCWQPPALAGGRRVWGLAVQLSLLRSNRNWGIGDYTDLCDLIHIAARWGADVIGLNPLHALFPDTPSHCSPYSPSSRLFLNIFTIDLESVPGFANAREVRQLIGSDEFRRALAAARSAHLVDMEKAAELKLAALRLLFRDFKLHADLAERAAFDDFRANRGRSLEHYALFQAIRFVRAAANASAFDWREWPEELRDPNSSSCRAFAQTHQDEIDFIAWSQWIADRQLRNASDRARKFGMAIGLYRDLAIGANGSGAETWSNPQAVASKAHAGAPPDLYNPAGQDWGLPPFNPLKLKSEGYNSFIELLRANMRYAGGLRIDHVAGLRHLYWVPEGKSATEGVYVNYPFDDLLNILALESVRHQCLVIGEDLGTVPQGLRESLAAANVLSCRVLYFEQNAEREFTPPNQYPIRAIASISTHDLPTLKGWWRERDIAIHDELGLYPDAAEARRQRAWRAADKRTLIAALRAEDLIDPGLASRGLDHGLDISLLAIAIHSFLAQSNAAMMMVQIDDLTGEEDQVNLPATADEYPNWRRRLALTLDELATDLTALSIVDALRQARTPPSGVAATSQRRLQNIMDNFTRNMEEIRRRAREHIEKGAITDEYHADRAKVVEILNRILAIELVCVLRYKRHFYTVRGINSEDVKKEFAEHAMEAQQHADQVAQRIVELNGAPDFNPEGLAARSPSQYSEPSGIYDMIKEDLIAERVAIEYYSEFIRWIRNDDLTTKKIMTDILAVEEQHAEDMKKLLAKHR